MKKLLNPLIISAFIVTMLLGKIKGQAFNYSGVYLFVVSSAITT